MLKTEDNESILYLTRGDEITNISKNNIFVQSDSDINQLARIIGSIYRHFVNDTLC